MVTYGNFNLLISGVKPTAPISALKLYISRSILPCRPQSPQWDCFRNTSSPADAHWFRTLLEAKKKSKKPDSGILRVLQCIVGYFRITVSPISIKCLSLTMCPWQLLLAMVSKSNSIGRAVLFKFRIVSW